MQQRTYMQKPSEVDRKWYTIDAEGQTLGRMATQIAILLRGKHKPTYTPHVDGGDFVIVTNARKVALTGDKWTKKVYYRHSGHPGGLKETTAAVMRGRQPERIIELAVKGMLPKGTLGSSQLRKLKIYADAEHPHSAQNPEAWSTKPV